MYIHTSPKGKRYVGITSKSPQERWRTGGKGYESNKHFWSAIVKYGWDNFSHEIIKSNLSLDEACSLEIELIAKYNCMNPKYGYNQTTGGNWNSPNEEVRNRLSKITRSRCQDPEYIRNISEKLKCHPVSEETKKKISEKAKGRKMPQSHVEAQRRRKHSPETIAKLRGHSSWIAGLSKETDERVRMISDKLTGRVISESQKHKQSIHMKSLYANGYNPIWITDGEIETLIDSDEQIPKGFTQGRLNFKNVYVYKENESRKISESELDNYLSDGWACGRPSSVGDSIRKSKQKFYWRYEGQRFDSSNDLAAHLRVSGYPNIVGGTITNLIRKGFSTSKKYRNLEGKIEKVYL